MYSLKLLTLGTFFLVYGQGWTPNLTLCVAVPNDNACAPDPILNGTLPDAYNNCTAEVNASKNQTNPDKGKTTEEIIKYYNYTLEIYNVTTTDGYILTVHRITGSPLSPPPPATGPPKPSIYLHHGMGGSSDNWLFQPGNRNLPFKLADAGYDVWITNCRGTTYSLGHTKFNYETDVKYWDFSWHEMAMYDVPAVMDKITAISGNQKMYFIGYSMGTTVYFITLSEIPAYNDRVIAGFMLSPVAYNGHASNFLRYISPALGTDELYLDPVLRGRIDQAQQIQSLTNYSLGDYCTPTAARCGVCANILLAAFGFDAPQMNYTNLPNILSKFPNIISVKTLVHYSQSMNTCDFRQFDYGAGENFQKYGNINPPAYNLTNITAPTYFFYGDMDNLAVPQDVEITRCHMRNGTVLEKIHVDWYLFNHLDFQWAKDADILVYNKVLTLINQYNATLIFPRPSTNSN